MPHQLYLLVPFHFDEELIQQYKLVEQAARQKAFHFKGKEMSVNWLLKLSELLILITRYQLTAVSLCIKCFLNGKHIIVY